MLKTILVNDFKKIGIKLSLGFIFQKCYCDPINVNILNASAWELEIEAALCNIRTLWQYRRYYIYRNKCDNIRKITYTIYIGNEDVVMIGLNLFYWIYNIQGFEHVMISVDKDSFILWKILHVVTTHFTMLTGKHVLDKQK